MCGNLSHRELLNLCRTVSAAATAHILRRCTRARHACARHFNAVQSTAPTSRAEHAHFLCLAMKDWETERLKDSFARFIILYNSSYAVLFITTHAMHCDLAVLRNQLKSYKNTRFIYCCVSFRVFAACILQKTISTFLCKQHCTKLPKWQ